uniref:hypothetical protein n=1 Tax=Gracilaria urvillei TaxID=172974 RepID=UPI001D0F995E|nr:hypothetical protein LK147_pgp009 [Hydropuntia urvillei]UAD88531.1 hypothetical protein [Hydropuntia urvillei]
MIFIYTIVKNEQKLYKKKIELLLISIEAINLYNLDDNHKRTLNSSKINYYLHNLFLIRCGNLIKHPKNYSLYNFKKSIQLIYYIHNSIYSYRMQSNIYEILETIHKTQKSNKIKQYLNRFKYVYYKTQNYYNIMSNTYTEDKFIVKIAILNLYIIHISSYKEGIYFLIKYLKMPYLL